MLNKRKNNKVSLFAVIMLVMTMLFSNVASINVFAQTLDGESSLTAQSLEINYEEDNLSYYQVYFEPYEHFTSFSLKLEFPSFITVEDVLTNYQLGADEDGFVGSMTSPYAGQYTCDFQDNIVSVALASIEQNGYSRLFTVAVSANDNLSQTGEVSVREMQFLDINDNVLNVNVELGSITVNKQRTAKMGDVDGNNVVNMIDLITVQRSITNLSGNYALTEDQKVLADINCDGEVSILDCQIIRKYLVGLVESLEGYVNPVYEYHNLNIYLTDLNGNSKLENTVTLVKETNVLDFLMEYAYSNGLTVEKWYSDRWCSNEIQDNLTLFVDLNAYGIQESVEPEPEDPPTETPSSYWLSVSYYGESGITESAGAYEVPAGQYLVPYLREIASGRGTELYSVYPDGSMQNEIDETLTVDEYVSLYGAEVWVTFDNGENGDGGNGGNGDEARQFTITFYVNGEYMGSQTATAGESLRSVTETWYIVDMAGEIDEIYYDADKGTRVDEADLVECDRDIYIFTVAGDEHKNLYVITFYGNENGEWGYKGETSAVAGTNIYQILEGTYGSEEGLINGVYYDAEMTCPVSYEAVLEGTTSIYLNYLVNENTGNQYTVNFFGNTTVEATDWEIFFSMTAIDGQIIYDIIHNNAGEQMQYVEGVYYDAGRASIVSPEHVISADIDSDGDKIINIYLYSSVVGEDLGGGDVNKENMLYVSVETQNGEQLDYVNVPIGESEYILTAISNTLNAQTSVQAYYNDGYRTQVTDTDVFTTETNRSIIVIANKLEVVFCSSANQGEYNLSAYAFDGDILLMRVGELISKKAPNAQIKGIYSDISLDASTIIDGNATVNGDTTVFALIYSNEAPSAYVIATCVEVIGGIYTEVNGFSAETTAGNNIISSISTKAQSEAGYIYNIVGYYYDLECTSPVGETDCVVEGLNEVYILFTLKDIAGEYTIMSMDDSSPVGKLTLRADNTATIVLKEETYSGTWNATMGMLFVNVGTYSQYIFMVTEMGTDVVAGIVSEFNGDERPVDESLNAIAGTYTWTEEYTNEDGETIAEECVIVLYNNGVHQTTARGLVVRGEYEIVYGNIVSITVMREPQCFDLDKENGTATINYLVEYVGTHDIKKSEYNDGEQNIQTIGTFTVEYDGTAFYTIDGKTVVCTANAKAGTLYLCKGQYDMVEINYYTMNGTAGFWLEYMFDGSDYAQEEQFSAYVGEYDYLYYDSKYTLEFYANGVYKMTGIYGDERLGSYRIGEGYLILDDAWHDEIAYSEEQGAYVSRHTLNQGGGETEIPKLEIS